MELRPDLEWPGRLIHLDTQMQWLLFCYGKHREEPGDKALVNIATHFNLIQLLYPKVSLNLFQSPMLATFNVRSHAHACTQAYTHMYMYMCACLDVYV